MSVLFVQRVRCPHAFPDREGAALLNKVIVNHSAEQASRPRAILLTPRWCAGSLSLHLC